MSINVYLKGEEVRKKEGFETKLVRGKNETWNEYRLPGIHLFYEKGRWYIILHEPTEPIPAAIAGIVEEISLCDWVPRYRTREAGIYSLKSAEAEVDSDKMNGRDAYEIKIRAKNMKDVIILYRKIRFGHIRPENSYEEEQVCKSVGMVRNMWNKVSNFLNKNLN